jgi:hypothetical protein
MAFRNLFLKMPLWLFAELYFLQESKINTNDTIKRLIENKRNIPFENILKG